MNNNVVPITGQFRFAEDERVYWPVTVVQFGDNGQDHEHEIEWLVSLLKRDTHEKLAQIRQRGRQLAEQARQGADVTDESLRIGEEMAAVVLDNVHGWRGIVDEAGEALEANAENKERLLANTRLFNSALAALFAASSGAKRKNSKAGAGG